MLKGIEQIKEADPLIALADGIFDDGKEGGQLQLFKLAPNFEMAMYLAQATGAAIVTDSPFRWRELRSALRPRPSGAVTALHPLAKAIAQEEFFFPASAIDIATLGLEGACRAYPAIFGDTFRYLRQLGEKGAKPNWESHIVARFAREHRRAQTALASRDLTGAHGRMHCAFPGKGIQHNTVNRLLLMSSSEHHLPSVPMAVFIEPRDPPVSNGDAILRKETH